LLDELRDDNQQAWETFVNKYTPVIRGFVRTYLPLSEVDDVVQNTLSTFVKAYRKGAYTRSKGSFRSWLGTIAINKARELWRTPRLRDARMQRSTDTTGYTVSELAADPRRSDLEMRWDQEWAAHLLASVRRQLCCEFEPESICVFDLCVIENRSTSDVAQLLRKTTGAVATTKFRTRKRFIELARDFACSHNVVSDVRWALKRQSHRAHLGGCGFRKF
jgi:RNA polymerase sigma-70 factor (ECF subfamily)